MDQKKEIKIEIAEEAANKYLLNKRFTIQALAKDLDLEPSEIFNLFPNRKSILLFYYESRIELYRDQKKSIKNYSEYTLSEKLSNLILTVLDLFTERREFVLNTYKPFIVNTLSDTAFEKSFKSEIKSIFESDHRISATAQILLNQTFYAILFHHFHALILFWAKDESAGRQQSFALVDKWCSFVEELFYNKIIDKGFDLGKFLFYNSPLKNLFSDSTK